MNLLAPTIMGAALLDSINPCAISVLFLTIAFLVSLGKSRKDVLKIGGVYILGIFLIYILIGLGLTQALLFLGVPKFMSRVGAVLLMGWGGINLAGSLWKNFPIKLAIPDGTKGKIAQLIHTASMPGALGLGLLVGATEFPCTGGPYLFVLGLLHDRATFWQGFGYLVLYNIIFVAPLVVILWLASDSKLNSTIESWKKKYTTRAEIVSSVLLILLGGIILLT
jgi:cytochrome c biogenesis protein CcdA